MTNRYRESATVALNEFGSIKVEVVKMTNRIPAGSIMPSIEVPRAFGSNVVLGGPGWKLVVIYRGQHCPLCRLYLRMLNELLPKFGEIGVSVIAVSADTQAEAEKEVKDEAWRFPVGYALTAQQMAQLGLYVSNPRTQTEASHPFPEPGLFVINEAGQIQIVDVSNAPFCRPDLKQTWEGIKFIREKQYPICGTAELPPA